MGLSEKSMCHNNCVLFSLDGEEFCVIARNLIKDAGFYGITIKIEDCPCYAVKEQKKKGTKK